MLVMGTLKRDPPALIIWKPPFVVAHQADCKLDVREFLLAPSRARCDKPREAQFLVLVGVMVGLYRDNGK